MTDKNKSKHTSNSDTQKNIERIVIELLSNEFKKEFKNNTIEYEDVKFKLDFYIKNEDEIIIGEIYAGIDGIKPGQKKKIGSDFLKLITVEKIIKEKFPNHALTKILVVVDAKIKDQIDNSWLAKSASFFEITIKEVNLPEEEKKKLKKTKKNQGKNFLKKQRTF